MRPSRRARAEPGHGSGADDGGGRRRTGRGAGRADPAAGGRIRPAEASDGGGTGSSSLPWRCWSLRERGNVRERATERGGEVRRRRSDLAAWSPALARRPAWREAAEPRGGAGGARLRGWGERGGVGVNRAGVVGLGRERGGGYDGAPLCRLLGTSLPSTSRRQRGGAGGPLQRWRPLDPTHLFAVCQQMAKILCHLLADGKEVGGFQWTPAL